ncbi:hypothetical protein CPB85DRAFT_553521 [Mucidula mucida]|nr:hypothetical protein CPB85DRAFT_553521 [Mucidula mucida]
MSPSAPMLPTVLAVEVMTLESDWSSVHFMTDRNGLRKLMQWVTGKRPDFRLDFHLLGKRTVSFHPLVGTVFLGLKRYNCFRSLGALKLVVRYEVDACTAPDLMEDLTSSLEDQSLQGLTPLKIVAINRSNTISIITVPQDVSSDSLRRPQERFTSHKRLRW